MRSLCIMPVYDQVEDLPALLEKCHEGLVCDELLIVDDGSQDGSTALIEKSGFQYMRFEKSQGIGHALIQGTKFAISKKFDVVVHLAGNGKMLPREMSRVLDPILENRADYVWGSRFLPGGRFVNPPAIRKFGIPYLMNNIPRVLFGKRVTDASCGYRAYRTSILTDFIAGWDKPWLYGYEFEYFVLAKVFLSHYRYLEVPISMVYPTRKRNYSKIIPVISWWSMLKPWLVVRLGLEPPARALLPQAGLEFPSRSLKKG